MKTNWQTKKLDEICNVDYGTRIVKTRNIPGDFDVYGGGGKTFTSNEYNREDCFIVSRFAMSTNCVRRVEGKFFLNDSGLSVSTKDKDLLSQDFLDRFLLASQDLIYSLGRGQAQRNLHIEGFKNIEIPLPPLETQQKIVARLDELLGNIAQAKRLRQEAIADTEKILSQTLREIFEEGKEKGWEEKELGEYVKLQGGFAFKSSEYKVEGVPLIRIQNLQEETIDLTKAVFIKEKESYEKFKLMIGDILVAMSGATTGKLARVNEDSLPAYLNQRVGRFIILDKAKVSSGFLWYFMNHIKKYVLEESYGGAQPNISPSKIESIKIILPSLTEQQSIVTRLDKLSAQLRELRELQQSQLDDLKKLEKAYLREAFHGELL